MEEKFIKAHTAFFKKFGNADYSYRHDELKNQMHRAAMRYLRLLAAELNIAPGTFDIRSNKAGVAVSGEITLHSDHVYIQLSQSFFGGGNALSFMIRGCGSRKDYCGRGGGGNNFVELRSHNIEEVARVSARELVNATTKFAVL